MLVTALLDESPQFAGFFLGCDNVQNKKIFFSIVMMSFKLMELSL
jgi:hypothetical protein